MSDIEKLIALLKADTEGKEIAKLFNEFLIDSRRRDMLLIKLEEVRREMSTLSLEIKLTKSEEVVISTVLSSKKPLTAQEIASKVGNELRSLKHTTHASTVSNSLVSKGILGKF